MEIKYIAKKKVDTNSIYTSLKPLKICLGWQLNKIILLVSSGHQKVASTSEPMLTSHTNKLITVKP